jgi:hypothetical protein
MVGISQVAAGLRGDTSSGVKPGGGTTAASGVSSGAGPGWMPGALNVAGRSSGCGSSFGLLRTCSGGSCSLTAICGASSTLLPQRARMVVTPSVITCSPAKSRESKRARPAGIETGIMTGDDRIAAHDLGHFSGGSHAAGDHRVGIDETCGRAGLALDEAVQVADPALFGGGEIRQTGGAILAHGEDGRRGEQND